MLIEHSFLCWIDLRMMTTAAIVKMAVNTYGQSIGMRAKPKPNLKKPLVHSLNKTYFQSMGAAAMFIVWKKANHCEPLSCICLIYFPFVSASIEMLQAEIYIREWIFSIIQQEKHSTRYNCICCSVQSMNFN